ncbi:MAG: acyl carrier protein [Candidatus Eremiobacteraeota bacterium]|nr:acyl carrier protein [Candidatus Eremiobacteraeota bacterium]
MTEAQIYDGLTKILQDVFDDDTLVARSDLTAADVDGWDSFAHLRVIFGVEKTFGISLSASQISGLKNVGELATVIESKVTKR